MTSCQISKQNFFGTVGLKAENYSFAKKENR